MSRRHNRASNQRIRSRSRRRSRLEAAGPRVVAFDSLVELQLANDAEGGEGGNRLPTFAMVAYTGGAMRPRGYSGGGPAVVVDLAGLRALGTVRPILRDHDPRRIVGHTSAIENNGRQLRIAGTISGVGPDAAEVVGLAKNGFAWQASIGASIDRLEFVEAGERVSVNGRSFVGPIYIVRASTLAEVSFVAIGADQRTTARVAATITRGETMGFSEWLAARGFVENELTAEQLKYLKAQYDAEIAAAGDPNENDDDDTSTGGDGGDGGEAGAGRTPGRVRAGAAPGATAADLRAQMREEAAAEIERQGTIRDIAAQFGDPQIEVAGQRVNLAAHAIREGWDAPQVELHALRASRQTPQVEFGPSAGGLPTAAVVECALMQANGFAGDLSRHFGERVVNAASESRFRGYSLHALLFDTIRAAGGYARAGIVNDDTIRAAFLADRQLQASSGGASTYSLSGVLSSAARKFLLAAYQAVERVSQVFCNEVDNTDFKTHNRYRMTGVGQFVKVAKDGQLKHGTLTDASYTNKLDTYGRMLTLTRQDQIDDDLGAFTRLASAMGRQAVLAIEEAVFILLLSNPSNFFHANNRNLKTGAGSVLAVDGLSDAEQALMDQVDSNNKPILVRGAVLLVPSSLKVTAARLYTEDRLNETTTADKGKPANNPHVGKYKPCASSYLNNTNIKDDSGAALSGQSSTAWYLFANPADVAAMEIAYLRGQRLPTIQSGEADINTLGMTWRGFFDFGVAMQDPVGAVKSTGA